MTKQFGLDCRTFSAWSHTVAMLFAQLTHALGLNCLCDSLRLHSRLLAGVYGATPPSRNNLSNANRTRSAEFIEALFWKTLSGLHQLVPGFRAAQRGRGGRAHRFKANIHLVDATVIQLIASCMAWAKHRRRKAAAKCHIRLDLASLLPRYAIVDTAKQNDGARARELCAGLRAGEIVVFDRAYFDLAHLYDLFQRGVFWVTRAKDNLDVKVSKKRLKRPQGKILRDDEVVLRGQRSSQRHPERLRRVTALVEVDGQEREMVFLTNNFDWQPSSVAELYRCRWQIEVFFKQIKQTLKLSDFLGNSANAVRWQMWSALLCYVLLRFQAFLCSWVHSFTRLWALIRTALWLRLDLFFLLKSYGTAGGSFRILSQPQAQWIPGLEPNAVG